MVELTHDEEFAVLTIRRPAALNALSFELIGRIGECIRESGRSSARALIVTGEGEKSFCAGADIKELQQRGLAAQREGAELGQAVFALLDRLPIPSVALVNGFAFGGGCELALGLHLAACAAECEVRSARRSSLVSFPAMAAPSACRASSDPAARWSS